MTLTEAIETLASTYADPVLIARGLPVDAQEVATALAAATPDTTEFVALKRDRNFLNSVMFFQALIFQTAITQYRFAIATVKPRSPLFKLQ
jgi:hypothetical protein